MIHIQPKIYKSIFDWYYPEIPYEQMIKNFRMTESFLTRHVSPMLSFNFPLSHVSFMDYCGAFRVDQGHKQQMFQFWNEEYNDEIVRAIYLLTKQRKPKLILDVCAGDGMLAALLKKRGFKVKAVDDYTWPFTKRYFEVEKLDYKEAIKKYRPDFIIGCWMPYGTDWTPYFRKIKSVQHYMIIGEDDQGCCGGNWDDHKGWKMRYHRLANPYSVCRTDVIWSFDHDKDDFGLKHSRVYTFSRI